MEGKERHKTEADHSCLAGGRFNKQGNLHTRLILGGHKTSRSPQLPTRMLKVCIEVLWGLIINTIQMVSITPYSFKVTSLKELWLWEPWAECTFQGQGREWGASDCPGLAHINWRSYPLKDPSKASWIQNLAPSLTSSVEFSPIIQYLCLMFLILKRTIILVSIGDDCYKD